MKNRRRSGQIFDFGGASHFARDSSTNIETRQAARNRAWNNIHAIAPTDAIRHRDQGLCGAASDYIRPRYTITALQHRAAAIFSVFSIHCILGAADQLSRLSYGSQHRSLSRLLPRLGPSLQVRVREAFVLHVGSIRTRDRIGCM